MCYFLWEKLIVTGIAIKFTKLNFNSGGRELDPYEYTTRLLSRIPLCLSWGTPWHGRGDIVEADRIENGKMEGEGYK